MKEFWFMTTNPNYRTIWMTADSINAAVKDVESILGWRTVLYGQSNPDAGIKGKCQKFPAEAPF